MGPHPLGQTSLGASQPLFLSGRAWPIHRVDDGVLGFRSPGKNGHWAAAQDSVPFPSLYLLEQPQEWVDTICKIMKCMEEEEC